MPLSLRRLWVLALLLASACSERPSPTLARALDALVYRLPPDATGDLFVGQLGASFGTVNKIEGREVNAPDGMALDRTATPPRLYAVDSNNHRVLAWRDAAGFQSGATADLVLGQTDVRLAFNGCTLTNELTLCTPRDVAVDAAGNVYVSDTGHHRVLEFDRPFDTDQKADRVFGQNGSFFTSTPNLGAAAPTAGTMSSPAGLALSPSGALLVVDSGNNRVLRFDAPLTSAAANAVLGQPDLTQGWVNWPDERGLQFPSQVAVDPVAKHVYVADTNNHRVLGWTDYSTLVDGQQAAVIIGQPDAYGTSCNQGRPTGPTDATLCRPRGLAVDAAGNLYVADTENNRVVRFPSPFAAAGGQRADLIYGQATSTSRGCISGNPAVTSLCAPRAVAVAPSGELFVADTNDHRVLRFIQQGTGADLVADGVFGQPSLTVTGCNTGGVVTASTLCSPRGVAVDRNGNLYVSDSSNNRVLEYDAPLADAVADRVFGQGGNPGTNACNPGGSKSAATLCAPGTVAVDGNVDVNVYVADEGNNRVLGYRTPLIADQVADAVLGQASFVNTTTCTSTSSTCMPSTVPGVGVDPTNGLFVADAPQNRVLWFAAPMAVSPAAGHVLGQADLFSGTPNWADIQGLNAPGYVAVDATGATPRLFVSDTGNHRVLVYNTDQFTNALSANLVVGQAGFNVARCNAGGLNAQSLCTPQGLALDASGKLLVADSSNHRVLQYAPVTASRPAATAAVGQVSLIRGACNDVALSDKTLCGPRAVALLPDGSRAFVSDRSNNRITSYPTPLATAELSDRLLGQPSYTVNGLNWMDGAGLSGNFGLAFDRRFTPYRVYVADRSNHRVLGWSSEANLLAGAPADLVLGQPNMGSSASGKTISTLNAPWDVAVDRAGRVYVSDNGNNRVLVFADPYAGTPPFNATAVLGQGDYTSNSCNRGGTVVTQNTLCGPTFLAIDPDDNLYVADTSNHRVLVFSSPGTTDTDADDVFGQSDLFSSASNAGGLSARSLSSPSGLAVDQSVFPVRLYIADGGNHRILSFDNPRGSDTQADDVIGQVNFTSNGAGSGVSKVSGPQGLAVDPQGNLYVADLNNSRVLLFRSPLTTDLNADQIFGQPTPSSAGCNSSGTASEVTLCSARAVAVDAAGTLLVSDSGNNRVVAYLANKLPRALNAALLPVPPTTAAALQVQYAYQDADGDAEQPPSVRWFKGAAEQAGLGGPVVPATALRRGDDWSVKLRVNDGVDLGDEVSLGPVTIGNGAPRVIAGPDVSLMIDQQGTLTAAAEDPDGDPVTLLWSQVSGPQVALVANGASATFQPRDPGVHVFQATASDGVATSDPAVVKVTVITHGADNHPPVAAAQVTTGRPTVGGAVELDGSASSDPDPLDRLSFRWTVVAFPTGNPPALEGATTARPSFVPDVAGPYAFRLRVSDGDLESAPLDVDVPVRGKAGAFGCSAAGGGGPALIAVAALLVLIARRRRRALAVIALAAASVAGAADKKGAPAPASGSVKLALPPPPPGLTLTPSGPAIPELEEARQLYLNFEFDGVLPRVERALAAPGITASQKMEAYKLKAFTHAAFDDSAGAQEAFGKLLELEPRYQLSQSASPKLRGYFADAKKAFLARQVVKLQHAPPPRSSSGGTPVMEVAVTAGVERVAAVTMSYRLSGTREYSQLPMAPVRPGAYSAPVPNLFDVPSGVRTLEYYLRARDPDGVVVASVGSDLAPLKMEVETVTLDSRRPLLQRWELWAVVGVNATAIAVPLLLRHDAGVQPGSLGLEHLP